MLLSQNIILAAVFVICALLGSKPGAMRQVMSYLGSIGLMVTVLGALGAMLLGRNEGKGYVMFFLGMLLGSIAGVVAGFFLARWSISNVWVYSTVVVADTSLMVLAPILVARLS